MTFFILILYSKIPTTPQKKHVTGSHEVCLNLKNSNRRVHKVFAKGTKNNSKLSAHKLGLLMSLNEGLLKHRIEKVANQL